MAQVNESKKTSSRGPLFLVLDLAIVAALIAASWVAFEPLARAWKAHARSAERSAAMASLSEDLDARFVKQRHYNPEEADKDAWYGFSPAEFPPGPELPWASDARWNQLRYRPESGASYRYGVFTRGQEAWLIVYGDVDGDGDWSQVVRYFSEGRLVREWQLRPDE
jgi:hypothetical protein